MSPAPDESLKSGSKPANFLRSLIEREVQDGSYAQRRWAGSPGDAAHQAAGQTDPAA